MAARKTDRKRSFKPEELRRMAIEAQGQLAGIEVVAGSESFLIPHPLMIDDAAQARIEQFQNGVGLDRDEDGKIVEPNKINGELAEPATTRLAKALLGEDHERFIAAGGHSNDIQLAWNYMVFEHQSAEADDPK